MPNDGTLISPNKTNKNNSLLDPMLCEEGNNEGKGNEKF